MNYKQCYGLIKQVAEKESKNKRYSIEESELAKEIFKREDDILSSKKSMNLLFGSIRQ